MLHEEADNERGDLDEREVHTLPDHIDTGAAGEDAVGRGARFAAHQVAFGLFHAERKARQRVGDHVDPQQMHRGKNREVEDGRHKHDDDFAHVGGKLELQHLADVVVDLAAFLNGVDDGCKVVVGEHHVGCALGHVGAGDAHADADVGALDGRCVVDAVAGHGGDHAARLPRFDDAGLMFGLDAGVDGIFEHLFHKLFVGELVEFGAHDGFFGVTDDAELFTDGNGGILVVAGDHHRADAGFAAFLDGGLHFRTHRVDHAGEAHKDKLFFKVGGVIGRGFLFILAQRHGQHAQRAVGHGLVRPQDIFADVFGHRHGLAGNDGLGAFFEDLIGRTLSILDEAFVCLMNRGHHLAAGIERCLADARLLFVELALGQAERIGVIDQRSFGGFTHGVVVFVQLGVAALRHGGADQLFVVAVMVDDGHLVLSQRTGFIRADDLGAAERFHSGQLADQRLAFTHGRDADGKDDRDHGGQTLGDGGHRQRDRSDEG